MEAAVIEQQKIEQVENEVEHGVETEAGDDNVSRQLAGLPIKLAKHRRRGLRAAAPQHVDQG